LVGIDKKDETLIRFVFLGLDSPGSSKNKRNLFGEDKEHESSNIRGFGNNLNFFLK